MTSAARAALLPLYVELYDKTLPKARTGCERILAEVQPELTSLGIEIVRLPTSRTKGEFAKAIQTAEQSGVHAIITLHLAYSPSLESINALCETELPLIVLDTTTDHSFGSYIDAEKLMYNHGIHGVQDMCNLLVRRKRRFHIVAGHWRGSSVLRRAADLVRASALADRVRGTRAGRIGDPFEGMGDFDVPTDVLHERTGVTAVTAYARHVASMMPTEKEAVVTEEMARDRNRYDTRGASDELLRKATTAGIAVRRWIETEELDAYALNFLGLTAESGFPAIPFLEAEKAMARGVGYAGEGDILTASLVGALSSQYLSTFTEMFCPDWSGNQVFLSHMGEINPETLVGTPRLIDKHWDFCPLSDSCVIVGRMKPGEGVFIDLAPVADEQFRLILAPAEITDMDNESFSDSVRGWMKPKIDIAGFLERYSLAGGTHHAAFSYDADVDVLTSFAHMMNWESTVVG